MGSQAHHGVDIQGEVQDGIVPRPGLWTCVLPGAYHSYDGQDNRADYKEEEEEEEKGSFKANAMNEVESEDTSVRMLVSPMCWWTWSDTADLPFANGECAGSQHAAF